MTDRPLTRPISRRAALGLFAASAAAPALAADDKKKADIEACVEKGLDWIKRNQAQKHWEAPGGAHPAAMSGVAGMALLMEGSTMREGKYSNNIQDAVEWFMKRAQPSGLLADPRNPQEQGQYIYGHGFGLLFLASAYGQEDDGDTRKKLEGVLQRAVKFSGNAQTSKGGWGYVSAKEMNDFDEGSTTITQLQALRACKNAGITVPKEIIDRAKKYLQECTTPRGGLVYNHQGAGRAAAGGERPPITAAAVACAFSSGQYNDEYAKKWIKFCKDNIPIGKGRQAHDEYQNYYLAQAIYVLGDDRYGEMFPKEPKDSWLTWSKYREATFDGLKSSQSSGGEWNGSGGWGAGPIFSTAVNLCILQLEKNVLPIYHR